MHGEAIGDDFRHELKGEDEEVDPLADVDEGRLGRPRRIERRLPRHRCHITPDGYQDKRVKPRRLDNPDGLSARHVGDAEYEETGIAILLARRPDHPLGRRLLIEPLETGQVVCRFRHTNFGGLALLSVVRGRGGYSFRYACFESRYIEPRTEMYNLYLRAWGLGLPSLMP